MKQKPLRPFLFAIIITFIIAGLAVTTQAQSGNQMASSSPVGTGFTFQGQLQDKGKPLNDNCDIQAGLWDTLSGGVQVGSTQTVNDVAVSDGRFTITLNVNEELGGEAFTGQARWLQIAVRCPAGSGSYTTLQPRQPLTATPYAQSLLPGATISGSMGTGTNAMLSLSNLDANGVGLRVFDTGLDGVFVDRAGRDGIYVGSAQQDGLFICSTGNETGCTPSSLSNGLEIGRAQDNGIYIESAGYSTINGNGIYICNVGTSDPCTPDSYADGIEIGAAYHRGVAIENAETGVEVSDSEVGLSISSTQAGIELFNIGGTGIYISNAGSGLHVLQASTGAYISQATVDGFGVSVAYDDGFQVNIAGQNGVEINESVNAFWAGAASSDGLYVQSAGFNGVDVTGGNLAGYFGGAVQITGGCTGCLLANFGINTGQSPLEPGDVVVVTGSQISQVDSTPMLMEVVQANGQGAVVGVVMGRAEEITIENPRPDELGSRLIPREGTAQPGEFVTIVTYGLAPVRFDDGQDTEIAVGQRLTTGKNGRARTLQTVEVNGVILNEAAPILGLALEAGDTDGDGLIWVLVNPN